MKRLVRRLLGAHGLEVSRLDRLDRNPLSAVARAFEEKGLGVVFDVGANEGQTCEKFAKAFPAATIHAFEPFPAAYEKLKDLAARLPTVIPNKVALGAASAELDLHVNSSSVTNSLLPNSPDAPRFQSQTMGLALGKVRTPVTTIDRYCELNGIKSIDLLKIDAQGYELRILEGARCMLSARRVVFVQTEVLFVPLYLDQCYAHEVYAFLWSLGYRLVMAYDWVWNHEGFASWCDFLFVLPGALPER